MKLQINSYIKRDNYEQFVEGRVLVYSVVTNKEAQDLPDTLTVNLSKSGNPKCDTPIKFLQAPNAHAGSFTSYNMMRIYIDRIKDEAVNKIEAYNLDLQEYQETKKEGAYPIVEENDDLVPPPILEPPEGMVFLDMDKMQAIHDLLFGDAELVYEDDPDEDED